MATLDTQTELAAPKPLAVQNRRPAHLSAKLASLTARVARSSSKQSDRVESPLDGQPLADIPRCLAVDVDEAVRVA